MDIFHKKRQFRNKSSYHDFNIDIMDANLSGPEPITYMLLPALGLQVPGKLTFFVILHAGLSDGITQGYYKPTASQLILQLLVELISRQEKQTAGSG